MDLIIKNKIIQADIYDILRQVKKELKTGKLHDIQDKGENVLITCPFHKDGMEKHPSCQVYAKKDSDLQYGSFHCFTCSAKGNLSALINACFDQEKDFGDEWLCERFGDIVNYKDVYIKPIEIEKKKIQYLDPAILDQYKYFHPYMFKRKLTEDIIRKFSVGYDEKNNCIVFPVWDEKGNLLFLTRRSVNTKFFKIDKQVDKPVYLLNYILKDNIQDVIICESQINTLTCWSWGYPAIGLFGTGDDYQYDILRKYPRRHYILCLDGDEAGIKGTKRLIKNLPKDCIIDVKPMPLDKDVNDLNKETFDKIPLQSCYDWLENNKN